MMGGALLLVNCRYPNNFVLNSLKYHFLIFFISFCFRLNFEKDLRKISNVFRIKIYFFCHFICKKYLKQSQQQCPKETIILPKKIYLTREAKSVAADIWMILTATAPEISAAVEKLLNPEMDAISGVPFQKFQ